MAGLRPAEEVTCDYVMPFRSVRVLFATVSPALAGPPPALHPFDIGSARSLPWDGAKLVAGKGDYKLQNLVATPRPCSLRHYGHRPDESCARRAVQPRRQGRGESAHVAHLARQRSSMTALFDAGYLTETYKQIAMLRGEREFAKRADTIAAALGKADGLAMLNQAITMRPDDASLQFAAALVAATADRTAYRTHADKARKGLAQDALLAKNINSDVRGDPRAVAELKLQPDEVLVSFSGFGPSTASRS